MRRKWLAGAAVAAVAVSVPVTALSTPAQAATTANATAASAVAWNAAAAKLAKKLVGDRYRYGGTSPSTGFDCSGLTQWVYRHTGSGKKIDRIAEDQYRDFKRISKKDAKPGDLVFFHDTSSPSSYVYHVGVYEGGNNMVAATTSRGGVRLQSFTWAGNTVTFGTITHK